MSLFDTGIRPLIDDYLAKEAAKVRDYGEYWSASSAGMCMRKVIFERLGVPPVSEDARKQRIFSSGHIFHEWLQRITKDAGISIAQELELQDEELMIRGHFDDLVLISPPIKITEEVLIDDKIDKGKITQAIKNAESHLILYDYKTAHSKWFEYVKDRPMSHYNKMQLGTYLYMLRKGLGIFNEFDVKQANHGELPQKAGTITEYMGVRINDLSEARILKISKDDLRLHEQQLLWSPELEKEVVGYWRTLNGYWKKKTIPKCTCADYEKNSKTGVGFMADKRYNPYYYNEQPCSIEYYNSWKEKHGQTQPSKATA